jgi:hypothetical protein
VSSNGRTAEFEIAYRGSIPRTPTITVVTTTNRHGEVKLTIAARRGTSSSMSIMFDGSEHELVAELKIHHGDSGGEIAGQMWVGPEFRDKPRFIGGKRHWDAGRSVFMVGTVDGAIQIEPGDRVVVLRRPK